MASISPRSASVASVPGFWVFQGLRERRHLLAVQLSHLGMEERRREHTRFDLVAPNGQVVVAASVVSCAEVSEPGSCRT